MLVESGVDCAPVVILLQLLLGWGVRGRGVCGKAGTSRTGAPPACQQVGLQPRNQTSTCTQVTQSGAPGGLEVRSHVHSEDRTMRTGQSRDDVQEGFIIPEVRVVCSNIFSELCTGHPRVTRTCVSGCVWTLSADVHTFVDTSADDIIYVTPEHRVGLNESVSACSERSDYLQVYFVLRDELGLCSFTC